MTVKILKKYFFELILHSIRVAFLSLKLSEGISRRQRRHLFFAALLHDIGKFNVRPEVLFKENALTNSEFMELKKHQILSVVIAKRFIKDKEVLRLIRKHHNEHSEGDSLLGILMACDISDSLRHKRSYRKTILKKEERIKIISDSLPHLNIEEVASYV